MMKLTCIFSLAMASSTMALDWRPIIDEQLDHLQQHPNWSQLQQCFEADEQQLLQAFDQTLTECVDDDRVHTAEVLQGCYQSQLSQHFSIEDEAVTACLAMVNGNTGS